MSASRRCSAGRSIVPPDRPPSSYAVLTSRQPSPVWLLMNASHASRCACSELKSCSSPSSEDLRVYMAQRRVRDLACSIAALLLQSLEAEEQRPRPSSSGDLSRDFRERTVTFAAETKSLFENAYLMADTAPFSHHHRVT